MAYEIHPLKGASQFEFGMTRDQVRAMMPPSYERHDEDIDNTSFDQYFELGVNFHYQSDLHLDGVQIYTPASAMLNGINMLSLTRGQAAELLTRLDPETRMGHQGPQSFGLGLWAWTEDPDDLGDDAPIETFLVAVPGFFGDPDADFSHMDVWELADGLGEVAQEFVREYFGERPDPKADPTPE